jgi:hypothetical protein
MAYGSGKRLGETIDPRLMMADFSGFERAGQIMGQGFANAGQQISGVIKQYGEDEKTIKKSQQMAKSIRDAIPELAGMADNALAELSNPDLSQRDRLAIAEGIQDSLKIGVMGLENNRSKEMLKLEADKIKASMQGKARNIMTADQLQQQIQSGAKVKYVPLGNGMYEVESATANEAPMFGNVMVGPNGQIQQAQSGSGNIRIPGANAGIQNALPQGQGGMFPDNVPTTGLPIGEAAGFTPGVSVDGSPGVLPPKEPLVIPAGEVPKGDVFSVEGDKVGVTRLPGSTPELEFQIKQAALEKAKLESGQIRGEKEKENKEITQAKDNFSSYVSEMANAYSSLFKKGGAVSAGQSNIGSMIMGTDLGQVTGRVLGTETQVMRDMITTMTPNLINVIRQSTQMGARGMDTPKELEFYLRALGDVNLPIEASVKALDTLDKIYGNGQTVPNILKDNPALMEKVKKSGLTFKGEETPTDKKGSSFIQDESILSDLEEYRKRKNQ